MHKIAPSILAADFGNLERDIRMINDSESDYIHCDIMDGIFVPNISYGMPVLKAVNKVATKPLDVHLMIEKPERYLEEFKAVGADILTVHQEACIHLDRTLNEIRRLGMKAGVSLNPSTPVEVLRDVLPLCDLILIMSVNPGFGGQKFIENAINKVRRLKKMVVESGSPAEIEVDGGVNGDNAPRLIAAGADVLVAGSYIFKSDDPKATIAAMKTLDPHVKSV